MILRCPECRTRRTTRPLLTRHIEQSGHRLCWCAGGYNFAHRPGSPMCLKNPVSALLLADRDGAGPDDLKRCAAYIIETNPECAGEVSKILKLWGL